MIEVLITKKELEQYIKVSDKELNDLFQEVRAISNKWFLQERTWQIKKWFRKDTTQTLYSLMYDSDAGVQLVNFAREWEWSLNTDVPKSYIMTFFFGFLSGIEHKAKQPPVLNQ